MLGSSTRSSVRSYRSPPSWSWSRSLIIEVEQIEQVTDCRAVHRDVFTAPLVVPRVGEVVAAALGQRFQSPVPFDELQDRKSTRLNSSHLGVSYAVFCLK